MDLYEEVDGEFHFLNQITGPFMGVTKAGTQRAGYAVTDCVWTCFYATELTNVEEIEKAMVVPHVNPLMPWLLN